MVRGADFGTATTIQASGPGLTNLHGEIIAVPLPRNAYDRLGGNNNRNATSHCRFLYKDRLSVAYMHARKHEWLHAPATHAPTFPTCRSVYFKIGGNSSAIFKIARDRPLSTGVSLPAELYAYPFKE